MKIKRFRYKVIFVLVLTLVFYAMQMMEGVVAAQGTPNNGEDTELPEPVSSSEPTATPIHTASPTLKPSQEPEVTQKPGVTPEPVPTLQPNQTQEPYQTPEPQALKPVKKVKLVRFATDKIKVTWKKQKKAKYYRVFYSKKKAGKYRCAGVTKSTQYLVKKLKNNTTYYFYVQACMKKKKSELDSAPSDKVCMKTKTYQHKTVFAGDSICEAIGYPGWAYPYMNITGKKKVIAYRGLNTVTFHTKRLFNGRTGLQKLIAEKPYRAYMMLGMNEIHYSRVSDMIAEYKGMIQAIRKACPDTDIVLCAVSPVTRAERAHRSGYQQISTFNKKLKKLAKNMGIRYFDYTAFLKDSGGYLKVSYAERDGYHWRMPVYSTFAKIVTKYDRSLDH